MFCQHALLVELPDKTYFPQHTPPGVRAFQYSFLRINLWFTVLFCLISFFFCYLSMLKYFLAFIQQDPPESDPLILLHKLLCGSRFVAGSLAAEDKLDAAA